MIGYLPSLARSFRPTLKVTSKPSFSLPHVASFAFLRRNSSSSSSSGSDIVKSPAYTGTPREHSLEQDLRSLIDHPIYSDIEISCKDERVLLGCKAILASRSEVFDRSLYNYKIKENNEKSDEKDDEKKERLNDQISFPNINYSGMKIILEYIYIGSIKKEFLSRNNIVEAYYAAGYFNLPNLQDFIIKTLKDTLKNNYIDNYSPELLSKAVQIIPLEENDHLRNLLVEEVATIPLNTIEFGRLSIAALQYLLSCTHEKEMLFATPEYEVLRYSAILAAKQVSDYACKSLMKQLPLLSTLEKMNESTKKAGFLSRLYVTRVVKKLEPLIQFIEFKRINGQILTDIIKPLKIIPDEIISSNKKNDSDLNDIRGIPIHKCDDYIWDESNCGPNLIIKNGGKVVQASGNYEFQSVRSKMALDSKGGIFEWDVIFEKFWKYSYVGVCASKNFNYEFCAGDQPSGWVLSNGFCYNYGEFKQYCPSFEDVKKITVHLDMNKKTCAFTVNGTKYPEVSWWNNLHLQSKFYPVVSLCSPAQCRIQPHSREKQSK